MSAALAALLAAGAELQAAVGEALAFMDQTLDSGFRPGMGNVVPDRFFWALPPTDDFPIVAETYRDCLQDVFDLPRLEDALLHGGARRGDRQHANAAGRPVAFSIRARIRPGEGLRAPPARRPSRARNGRRR